MQRISIHALREEGDLGLFGVCAADNNFYPRPPRGGRPIAFAMRFTQQLFLSTPSARRATSLSEAITKLKADFYPRPPRGGRRQVFWRSSKRGHISIHALREEGDRRTRQSGFSEPNFYPRPPRGGRRIVVKSSDDHCLFLSTPSARRATLAPSRMPMRFVIFLSTPSARRATSCQEMFCI